jgi:hypothetical protein
LAHEPQRRRGYSKQISSTTRVGSSPGAMSMHSAGSCRSNVGSAGHDVSVLLGLLYALTHRFECGWLTTQIALHHVPTARSTDRQRFFHFLVNCATRYTIILCLNTAVSAMWKPSYIPVGKPDMRSRTCHFVVVAKPSTLSGKPAQPIPKR